MEQLIIIVLSVILIIIVDLYLLRAPTTLTSSHGIYGFETGDFIMFSDGKCCKITSVSPNMITIDKRWWLLRWYDKMVAYKQSIGE